MIPDLQLWTVIVALGLGSFALRFSFLGLIGDRPLPDWIARLLRYTAVAILPAMVTPLVVRPASGDGALDPALICAALATLGAGYVTRNVYAALGAAVAVVLGFYLLAG